jgi:hypothetical protein
MEWDSPRTNQIISFRYWPLTLLAPHFPDNYILSDVNKAPVLSRLVKSAKTQAGHASRRYVSRVRIARKSARSVQLILGLAPWTCVMPSATILVSCITVSLNSAYFASSL